MRIFIHHRTHYAYPEKVQFSPHRILLHPREHPHLEVESFDLEVSPRAKVRWMVDAFENHIAVAHFEETSDEIIISARLVTLLENRNPFDFLIEPYAETYPFSYNPFERKALNAYLEIGSPSTASKVLPWIWKEFPQLPVDTLDLLTQLNHRIRERFQYLPREEEGVQWPDQTLTMGSGSCRDFALLFIEICRQLGFACRFVSGYFYDSPSGEGHVHNVAQGSMHAWTEVYLPGAGWKGLDPTNGILANDNFIPCAVANEPRLTSPIQGSYYHRQFRIPSDMTVSLTIEPAGQREELS